MRADIVPSAALPDYELSDHHGMRRKLSAERAIQRLLSEAGVAGTGNGHLLVDGSGAK